MYFSLPFRHPALSAAYAAEERSAGTINLSIFKPKGTIFDYIPSCLKANQEFHNKFTKFKYEQLLKGKLPKVRLFFHLIELDFNKKK
jgi:hypothetical protein